MEVRPMKQPKVKKQKQWGFDPNAKYNEYIPETFTKEYYEQLSGNKKNAWTKHMLNKDYKYDPKMMDPRYAAMKGAKRGLKAYFGDVNGDGVEDVALIDENGKIKSFNGFQPVQSKRRQLVKYYAQVGPEKLTAKGSPIYYPKATFDQWMDQTATHGKIPFVIHILLFLSCYNVCCFLCFSFLFIFVFLFVLFLDFCLFYFWIFWLSSVLFFLHFLFHLLSFCFCPIYVL